MYDGIKMSALLVIAGDRSAYKLLFDWATGSRRAINDDMVKVKPGVYLMKDTEYIRNLLLYHQVYSGKNYLRVMIVTDSDVDLAALMKKSPLIRPS